MLSLESYAGRILARADGCRMSKVCESWSLDELCDMDEQDMEYLLKHYKPGKVPSLREIRGEDEPEFSAFDGSFGWW